MKKKLVLISLLAVATMSMTGCNFFNYITSSSSESTSSNSSSTSSESTSRGSSSSEEDPSGKMTLNYSIKDLADHSAYSNFAVTPSIGNPKFLILPVYFQDSNNWIDANKKNEILTDLNTVMFGTNEQTGWYSLKTFYEEESHGLCNISGMVAPWYESNLSTSNIRNNQDVINVVNYAVSNWKANNPSLIKDYDSNNDGIIDAVITIYGAPNYSNEESLNDNVFWAYTSWTTNSKNIDSPVAKPFIWASYDFMYSDNTHGVNVDGHTYIHETGHLFGLDDYYDYNRVGDWAASFSMQDCNIGGHDPYSMLALGWAKPYVPTETTTYEINSFVSSGDVILLAPNFSGSPFDEYVLVELYSPTLANEHDSQYNYQMRRERGPSVAGIRIWHVDSRLITSVGGRYVTTTSIENGKTYLVGPTNTTIAGTDYDSYASKDPSLTKYHLLELIRAGDYTHHRTDRALSGVDLFYPGLSFTPSKYSSYFPNSRSVLFASDAKFNNGQYFDWEITINSVSNTTASITVTKK